MRINRSNRAIVFGQRLAEPAASPFLVGMVYDVRGSYTPAFFALAAFSVLTAILLFFASPPARNSLTVSRSKVAAYDQA